MIGWIVAAIVTVVFVIGVLAYRRRVEGQLRRIEQKNRTRLRDVVSESEARVERLERESDVRRRDHEFELVREILPALDSLREAARVDPESELGEGVAMALTDLERALEQRDFEIIDPEPGAPYDPQLHEAIDVEGDGEERVVGQCHRIGIRAGERIVRPAMVSVARR